MHVHTFDAKEKTVKDVLGTRKLFAVYFHNFLTLFSVSNTI